MSRENTGSTASPFTYRHKHITAKRMMDSVLIIATAPLTVPIGLATAAVVRAKMGSPVLYRQTRIGLGEKPFSLLKFRSMLPDVNSAGDKLSSSDRVTPFGALLRKSSLDELPQLINVLRGEMALVGPRPLLVEYLPYYKSSERLRHTVRPGITGPAQVNGRNDLGWDQRLALDADYARSGTIYDDIKIMVKTVTGVIKREGTIAEPWTQGEYLSVHRSYPSDGVYSLRRFEPQDVEARVHWLNDPRTRETLTVQGDITKESTLSWLYSARKNPLRKDLSVYEVETGRLVAIAGYKSEDDDSIPVLYLAVDPDLQGRGIGSATLKLLVDYMRSQPTVRGAVGEIYENNLRSIKIHERLGFEIVEADLPANRIRMEIRW